MVFKKTKNVLTDLDSILAQIKETEINNFKKMIYNANRLFFTGRGRSLLVLKAVAMRFMQFGFEVYLVGETNTPAFKEGDLLIAASGSGETKTTILNVEKAKKVGGKTVLLSADKNSTLAQISDQIIEIPAAKLFSEADKLLPGGSYFEAAVLILGDLLISNIADERGIKTEKLFERHANLE